MSTMVYDTVYGTGEYKLLTPAELIEGLINAGVELRTEPPRWRGGPCVRVGGRTPIPPGFLESWGWYQNPERLHLLVDELARAAA